MKQIYFIIIIIPILLLSSSGCVNKENKTSLQISYEINVIPLDNLSTYQINCPIPMTFDGKISKITDYLVVMKGNVSKHYTVSSHGISLNISSIEMCQLSILITQDKEYDLEDKYPILSLDKHYESTGVYDDTENNAEYYCYLSGNLKNSVYISIDFEIIFDEKANGCANDFNQKQSVNGNLNSGWNIINGNKSTNGS